MKELDRSQVEELTRALMEQIRNYYLSRPLSRERVFEVMNALAVCVGLVIQGSDGINGEAHRFFTNTLEMQLADLADDVATS
jgi:hypothetical protein